MELTTAVVSWLEAHGRMVINGSSSLALEMSKARQHAVLMANGIAVPTTHIAVGT
jgi:glutathione synthase/RimK-type ligase-like ATP-grasp enzyme